MCIRLNAKELLANILDSKNIKVGTVITRADFLRFQCKYDNIIPGHIFFETDEKDISQAISAFSNCCRIDQRGNIHVFSIETRPDRNYFNCRLPSLVAQTLPYFADYFAADLLLT